MGRIVVITGGTSGIGLVLKNLFEESGDTVLTFSLENNDSPNHYQGNIDHEIKVKQVFNDIHEKYGHIDILINCAGIGMSAITELASMDEIKRVMDVNYYGTLYAIRSAIPYMSSGTKIINMSSAMALFPVPFRSIYGSAKSAILNLSLSLRMELRSLGIDVIAFCPGNTKTNFTKNRIKNFESNARYGSRLENATLSSDANEDKRMTAEEVAGEIYKLINKKKSKPFYIIGKKYKFLYFLTRLTPKSLLINITGKKLGGHKLPKNIKSVTHTTKATILNAAPANTQPVEELTRPTSETPIENTAQAVVVEESVSAPANMVTEQEPAVIEEPENTSLETSAALETPIVTTREEQIKDTSAETKENEPEEIDNSNAISDNITGVTANNPVETEVVVPTQASVVFSDDEDEVEELESAATENTQNNETVNAEPQAVEEVMSTAEQTAAEETIEPTTNIQPETTNSSENENYQAEILDNASEKSATYNTVEETVQEIVSDPDQTIAKEVLETRPQEEQNLVEEVSNMVEDIELSSGEQDENQDDLKEEESTAESNIQEQSPYLEEMQSEGEALEDVEETPNIPEIHNTLLEDTPETLETYVDNIPYENAEDPDYFHDKTINPRGFAELEEPEEEIATEDNSQVVLPQAEKSEPEQPAVAAPEVQQQTPDMPVVNSTAEENQSVNAQQEQSSPNEQTQSQASTAATQHSTNLNSLLNKMSIFNKPNSNE